MMQQISDKSIVIMEDSAADYEALCRAFEKNEVTQPLVHLQDGEVAWQWLSDFLDEGKPSPALILLDLNLPGRDGLEILEQRQTIPTLARIPIIVFTTSNDKAHVLRCYELGANSIVQKPVDTDRLMEVVKNMKQFWLNTVMLPE